MKTQSVLKLSAVILATFTGIQSFADVPHLAPNCPNGLTFKVIDNSNGVYYNEKCDQAYYLPQTIKKARLIGFNPSITTNECDMYSRRQKLYSDGLELRVKRLSELEDSNADSQLINTVREEINWYEGKLSAVDKYLDGIGGKVVMQFKTVDPQEYQKEMIWQNIALVPTLAISPVTIADSYLSFATPELGMEGRAVVRVDIPGFQRVGESAGEVYKSIIANGSNSGDVWLSRRTACVGVKAQQNNESVSRSLGYFLSPNLTYSVMVRSNYGFTAKVEWSKVHNSIYNFLRTRTRFTVEDLSSYLINDQTDKSIELKIDLGQADAATKEKLTGPATQNAMNAIMQDLMDYVSKSIGGIAIVQNHPDAPNGGEVSVYRGTQRQCSRESKSFAGITYDSSTSCRDVAVYTNMWVDGRATDLQKKLANLNYFNEYKVKISEMVPRFHTSSFEVEP